MAASPDLGLSAPLPAVSEDGRARELRRRIGYLMLFRVVLITVVLGVTVALAAASPEQFAAPQQLLLFTIIVITYTLSLGYAFWLPRVANPLRFADAQLAGDLIITTFLVHVTGGAQSGYTFFYPLSIVGAATVRYRRGAAVVAVASVALFVLVALGGWLRIIPEPVGVALSDVPPVVFTRQLVLNVGACAAIAVLAGYLGDELARSGERLEKQRVRSLDLAMLKEDIIRCLTSGLLTIGRDGRVLTCNEAAGEILGVDGQQAIGRAVTELLPGLERLLDGVGERESVRRGEVRARDLVLGVSVSPLMNHRDEPIGRILNFSDLTELRRMEAQMKRAEKLAVIGGVAAAVAHEIRNPLASISGSMELLRAAPVEADNVKLMDIVLREVDRLNGLVTELLDYARPVARVTVEMDLGAALEETVRVFRQDRTWPGIEVALTVAAPAMVAADPAQVRQVVWNLLRNAAESMPGGGVVRLGLELEDEGRSAALTIADTGIGIAAEDLEHIFEPFFTTKRGGTGLGLPTVHRIITEHGGTVTVASSPGQGTTVTLRLPVAAGISPS
jgi:two-component system, NtrC family, sensor histidine kinase PilS